MQASRCRSGMQPSGGGRSAKQGFTILEIMVVVAIMAVLATIAMHSFSGSRLRAAQSEAKVNLKAIYSVLKAQHAESSTYRCGFCGWEPSGTTRYSYFATATESWEAADPVCRAANAGIEAGQHDKGSDADFDGFTATTTANIDSDPYCDAWYINDRNDLTNIKDDVDN